MTKQKKLQQDMTKKERFLKLLEEYEFKASDTDEVVGYKVLTALLIYSARLMR